MAFASLQLNKCMANPMLVDINQAELAFKEQLSPDVDLSAFILFVQYERICYGPLYGAGLEFRSVQRNASQKKLY